jgi:hypothetical protein
VGVYLRLIDSCITQLKAQGLSRTCNEGKEVKILTRTGFGRIEAAGEPAPLSARPDQAFDPPPGPCGLRPEP